MLFKREEEVAAVIHKDSVWLNNGKDTVTLQELENIPVSISEGCCSFFKKSCEERSLLPKIICISTTRGTALQWAAEQAAVSVIPREPHENLGNEFIAKKIIDFDAPVYKTVVKVKDRPLSIAAQSFLRFYAKTRNSQQVCDLEEILKNEAF